MSLKEMQALLARFYVDDSFLRLFEIEPNMVLGKYRLSDQERAAIVKLDPKEIRFFSSGLKAKRKLLLKKGYPALFALNEEVIDRYYIRFYNLNRVSAEDNTAYLLQRFGRFMEESLHSEPDLPAYASEVAKYERLCLWAKGGANNDQGNSHRSTRLGGRQLTPESRPRISERVRIATFEHFEINKGVGGGSEQSRAAPPFKRTMIFRQADLDRKMKLFEITEDIASLLELCDGLRSVSTIISDLSERKREDLREGIMATLERLVAMEAVEV